MFSLSAQSSPQMPLSLPLLKFSYATVPNDSVAPIPWIHLSSKNSLYCVFDTISSQTENGVMEERQKFKVLQDREVMVRLTIAVENRLLHTLQHSHVQTGRYRFEVSCSSSSQSHGRVSRIPWVYS